MSGPRTSHAGREPCWPWPRSVARLASPSSFEVASGAANGGSGSPASMPRDPGASVRSVLSVM